MTLYNEGLSPVRSSSSDTILTREDSSDKIGNSDCSRLLETKCLDASSSLTASDSLPFLSYDINQSDAEIDVTKKDFSTKIEDKLVSDFDVINSKSSLVGNPSQPLSPLPEYDALAPEIISVPGELEVVPDYGNVHSTPFSQSSGEKFLGVDLFPKSLAQKTDCVEEVKLLNISYCPLSNDLVSSVSIRTDSLYCTFASPTQEKPDNGNRLVLDHLGMGEMSDQDFIHTSLKRIPYPCDLVVDKTDIQMPKKKKRELGVCINTEASLLEKSFSYTHSEEVAEKDCVNAVNTYDLNKISHNHDETTLLENNIVHMNNNEITITKPNTIQFNPVPETVVDIQECAVDADVAESNLQSHTTRTNVTSSVPLVAALAKAKFRRNESIRSGGGMVIIPGHTRRWKRNKKKIGHIWADVWEEVEGSQDPLFVENVARMAKSMSAGNSRRIPRLRRTTMRQYPNGPDDIPDEE